MNNRMAGYLRCAFMNGAIPNSDPPTKLALQRIGELALPSGRLVASEPAGGGESQALTQDLPTGPHPVALSIANVDGDRRVAFAIIGIVNEKPAQWVMMCPAGQDPSAIEPDEIVGYNVDGGVGAFMDRNTAVAAEAKLKSASKLVPAEESPTGHAAIIAEPNELSDLIDDALENCIERKWAVIAPEKSGLPGPIFCFDSGWGDGFYATYMGLTAAGMPAVVVTDFSVFELTEL